MEKGEGNWRLSVAAAGVLLLATVVAAVLFLRNSPGAASTAPEACVSLWNSDRVALAYGSHNYAGHDYSQAEVLRLDRAGRPFARGSCAVVFASPFPDPERRAVAKIYGQGRWSSLSSLGVPKRRLDALQVEAVKGANAQLFPNGSLVSF